MATLFGAFAVFELVTFVAGLTDRTLRSGLLFQVLLMGGCAVGLWLARAWGRTLALLASLTNAGVGTLMVLAAFFERSSLVVPVIFLGVNTAVAIALTRSWFDIPTREAEL